MSKKKKHKSMGYEHMMGKPMDARNHPLNDMGDNPTNEHWGTQMGAPTQMAATSV